LSPPTTTTASKGFSDSELSEYSQWNWSLLRIICNYLSFCLVFILIIGIIASLNSCGCV